MTQKFLATSVMAVAGTVAVWGAVAVGSAASRLPLRQAAETYAVPLAAIAALSAACLGTAAAGAADLCSRND